MAWFKEAPNVYRLQSERGALAVVRGSERLGWRYMLQGEDEWWCKQGYKTRAAAKRAAEACVGVLPELGAKA